MALNSKQKQYLKAQAHHLKPVVMLGMHGLTANVQAEIERALADHELIKVQIAGEQREQRRAIAATICQTSEAELIQTIGKIIVLYRKKPDNR